VKSLKMTESKYTPISLSSYYLSIRYNDIELGTATGFFIKRNEKLYLITNWHVVSGRNAETGKCISKELAIPNQLIVKVHKNQDLVDFEDFKITLVDADDNPLWLEHPTHAKAVDVAALEVVIPENLVAMTVEQFIEPFNENTEESVADDVFILGYPFGLSAGEIFPIWKRASIASEPIIDIGGLPKILVDTASRPGMSGSPVILYKRRGTGIADSMPSPTKISHHLMKLIGVYSGRIGAKDDDSHIKAQLGIVWKSKTIEEIINQKVLE
jgi:hypothetical protein